MTDTLLTIPATCEKIAVSRSALYRMVKAGQLNPIKIGRSTRFSEADLDAFIQSLKGAA